MCRRDYFNEYPMITQCKTGRGRDGEVHTVAGSFMGTKGQ